MEPYIIDLGKIGNASIGYLTVAEECGKVPFDIKRAYWTYNTPADIIRGHHAHKNSSQVICALNGKIVFELEDRGGRKLEFILDSPSIALYIPGGYWRTIKFTDGAVLLCLSSSEYNEDDYIRDYDEFKQAK